MSGSNDTNYSFVDPATSIDHSGWLSVAIAIFGLASLLTLLVRSWIRLSSHGPWKLDDTAIAVAFAISLVQVATTGIAIHNGYGTHIDTLSPHSLLVVQKTLYASEFLYILVCYGSRMSSALLVTRLTRYKPHIRAAWAVMAFATLWLVPSVILVAVRGDISQPWATMNGTQTMYARWIAIEVVSILIEVMLFALSLYLIWGLQMARILRIMILTAFAARLLSIPVIALRLYYLAPSLNPDLIFSTIVSSILTQVVMRYGEIAASIICIKPFIRAFSTGYSTPGDSSVNSRDRYRELKPSNPPSTELSAMSGTQTTSKSTGTGNSVISSSGPKGMSRDRLVELRPDNDFRGHRGGFMARVQSRTEDEKVDDDMYRRSSQLEPEDLVVTQTRTWAVQREAIIDPSLR